MMTISSQPFSSSPSVQSLFLQGSSASFSSLFDKEVFQNCLSFLDWKQELCLCSINKELSLLYPPYKSRRFLRQLLPCRELERVQALAEKIFFSCTRGQKDSLRIDSKSNVFSFLEKQLSSQHILRFSPPQILLKAKKLFKEIQPQGVQEILHVATDPLMQCLCHLLTSPQSLPFFLKNLDVVELFIPLDAYYFYPPYNGSHFRALDFLSSSKAQLVLNIFANPFLFFRVSKIISSYYHLDQLCAYRVPSSNIEFCKRIYNFFKADYCLRIAKKENFHKICAYLSQSLSKNIFGLLKDMNFSGLDLNYLNNFFVDSLHPLSLACRFKSLVNGAYFQFLLYDFYTKDDATQETIYFETQQVMGLGFCFEVAWKGEFVNNRLFSSFKLALLDQISLNAYHVLFHLGIFSGEERGLSGDTKLEADIKKGDLKGLDFCLSKGMLKYSSQEAVCFSLEQYIETAIQGRCFVSIIFISLVDELYKNGFRLNKKSFEILLKSLYRSPAICASSISYLNEHEQSILGQGS